MKSEKQMSDAFVAITINLLRWSWLQHSIHYEIIMMIRQWSFAAFDSFNSAFTLNSTLSTHTFVWLCVWMCVWFLISLRVQIFRDFFAVILFYLDFFLFWMTPHIFMVISTTTTILAQTTYRISSHRIVSTFFYICFSNCEIIVAVISVQFIWDFPFKRRDPQPFREFLTHDVQQCRWSIALTTATCECGGVLISLGRDFISND